MFFFVFKNGHVCNGIGHIHIAGPVPGVNPGHIPDLSLVAGHLDPGEELLQGQFAAVCWSIQLTPFIPATLGTNQSDFNTEFVYFGTF